MSRKFRESCQVISQECIGSGIYSLWLQTENIAKEARPGQFLSVYVNDKSKILPRPISICQIDAENGKIRLVYRVTGEKTGTRLLSQMTSGDVLDILGPLGNGFPLEAAEGKRVFLMGGGIGIPPMLETAKSLNADKNIIVGYRDELFLNEELEKYGRLFLATEDGSAGTKGNVMDAVRENHLEADVIFACGPAPMLRAIKQYAIENDITCYISMEERMACGIGACLACVCKSKDVDDHSHVHNKRICKDGPVFLCTEVEL